MNRFIKGKVYRCFQKNEQRAPMALDKRLLKTEALDTRYAGISDFRDCNSSGFSTSRTIFTFNFSSNAL